MARTREKLAEGASGDAVIGVVPGARFEVRAVGMALILARMRDRLRNHGPWSLENQSHEQREAEHSAQAGLPHGSHDS
jgi:hypothetical protein